MASTTTSIPLKRGVSQTVQRRETLARPASTQSGESAKEKERDSKAAGTGKLVKANSVTDPVRMKRLLEKSKEENATLSQQLKELQQGLEKEQEASTSWQARCQRLEKSLATALAESDRLTLRHQEATSQLKEQAVREREQAERQMEATFSAQLRESQAGSARLRSQLHAAMHALERHGIDPISLEQLRSAEGCPAAAIEAGFESRVQSLRSALAAKKQALQGQIDEMQVVKETLIVLERGL